MLSSYACDCCIRSACQVLAKELHLSFFPPLDLLVTSSSLAKSKFVSDATTEHNLDFIAILETAKRHSRDREKGFLRDIT